MPRPRSVETRARTRKLLHLLEGGATLRAAATEARVEPSRLLRLLDEPEFFAVYAAIRDGRPAEAA